MEELVLEIMDTTSHDVKYFNTAAAHALLMPSAFRTFIFSVSGTS
jgi:hypothetical protein